MKFTPQVVFRFLVILFIFVLYFSLPSGFVFQGFVVPSSGYDLKKGLDIQGGTHLTLEIDMAGIDSSDRDQAHLSSREVINRRVDLYGVSEAIVQLSRSGEAYRIIVDLPGFAGDTSAIELLGQTAQLDFRESIATDSAQLNLEDFISTGLTGADLKRASVQFQEAQPGVALEFTSEGRLKFADITKRNLGKQVGIFLDEFPLTIPNVETPITDGNAIISGGFDTDTAKTLVNNLNAGALPAPIKIIEQKTIGPTLGAASVQKSAFAGLIGLSLVALFMILYYTKLGIIATFALIFYGLITLTIYKLLPVTITLPGLAGFLLSLAMATDSNILIFERIKEERRKGMKFIPAMELGFGRAWDSIKDANVATLITTFVLLNPFDWPFLTTSGMVRGFALTLGIGIIISLFTGIIVTRTLMRIIFSNRKN